VAASRDMDIPPPVRPAEGDRLVFSQEQFHRLLTERRMRVLFYAGFEADQCLQFKPYGIANMQMLGYLCHVIRDATTTYEIADTLSGGWRTRCADRRHRSAVGVFGERGGLHSRLPRRSAGGMRVGMDADAA
ncbi:MAG TPA: hypothetical protein VF234_01670, partial [Limnochordia bacterium]